MNCPRLLQNLALTALVVVCLERAAPSAQPADQFSNRLLTVSTSCGAGCLWAFHLQGSATWYRFAPPVFCLDGRRVSAELLHVTPASKAVHLPTGVTQYAFAGVFRADPHLHLFLQFEANEDTPVVRFRYRLSSDAPRRLEKPSGSDELSYFRTSFAAFSEVKEINLSGFAGLTHTYELAENALDTRWFSDGVSVMGPLIAGSDGRHSFLVGYEHGSPVPDRYLQFALDPAKNVELAAVKANYLSGQTVSPDTPFTTVWFETSAISGNLHDLARSYRRYVLHSLARDNASRQPCVFYNTWNLQERNKFWHHGTYLEPMNTARMLQEIDAAHRMGIDVFVLDTGWYAKTGDWEVDRNRFPDNLQAIRSRLVAYGMKLGLWIGPTTAAVSSRLVRQHPEWRATWNGQPYAAQEIWETEASYPMCLVSGYSDALADELIRVARQLGVTYFKWDWDDLPHHLCNDPSHLHGTKANAPGERLDSFRFQLIQRICGMADRITAAVPGSIIEFDITEDTRAMGLAFLSSGKYFLLNNGPYYFDYDVPIDKKTDNWNLFFQQGQARTWIARLPLSYDKWIPSILLLAHFFPDEPRQWQDVNLASLILGGNGIWGDLTSVPAQGAQHIADVLAKYKAVAEDITESEMLTRGNVSSSPEIYEKLTAAGRGAVVIFATAAGRYQYITSHHVAPKYWSTQDVYVSHDAAGRARIDADFAKPGAKLVFFGTE